MEKKGGSERIIWVECGQLLTIENTGLFLKRTTFRQQLHGGVIMATYALALFV